MGGGRRFACKCIFAMVMPLWACVPPVSRWLYSTRAGGTDALTSALDSDSMPLPTSLPPAASASRSVMLRVQPGRCRAPRNISRRVRTRHDGYSPPTQKHGKQANGCAFVCPFCRQLRHICWGWCKHSRAMKRCCSCGACCT